MDDLFSILGKQYPLKTLSREIRAAKIFHQHWTTIFGQLAKDLVFSGFANKILYIETTNRLWLTEIDYYKSIIFENFLKISPQTIVKDIKIKYNPTLHVSLNKSLKPETALEKDADLEAKIRNKNETLRKAGYILCCSCKKTLVKSGKCIYC